MGRPTNQQSHNTLIRQGTVGLHPIDLFDLLEKHTLDFQMRLTPLEHSAIS